MLTEMSRTFQSKEVHPTSTSTTMASTQDDHSGDLQSKILLLLNKKEPILSSDALPSQPPAVVKAALDSLKSRSMVDYETINHEELVLEAEAEDILANGSHEVRVFEALRKVWPYLQVY
jgi:phenylalanyl-tRNA synthetase alpha chain